VSLDFKYYEGEALAYKGLGFCEENVLNKFEAMGKLETALDKATENNLERIKIEILKDLVRVYQQIAKEYQIEGQYEMSLQFYDKCVHVS
jgi:tetratricopeptide (TPR) repeat protein|tara:strand:- start:455 stop:724 length:270 start_codon:yes stop_codon:yes gene_type:complete